MVSVSQGVPSIPQDLKAALPAMLTTLELSKFFATIQYTYKASNCVRQARPLYTGLAMNTRVPFHL